MAEHLIKDSTPATPALSLVYALDLQMDRILAEGLENRFRRHGYMARLVQDWVSGSRLALYAQEGCRSQTVTTVSNTLGLDIADLNNHLLERKMRIANGYGKLKGKTFRIAHMGDTEINQITALLEAIDNYIAAHS